jgi:hypothetical protein
MTKGDDIQERLIQFANKIVALCDTLSPTTTAERIGTELLRSTLTPALKLLETRLAETPKLKNYQTKNYQTTNPPTHLRFRQKKNEVKIKPILSRPTDRRQLFIPFRKLLTVDC